MKLDTASIALILSIIAVISSVWEISVNINQQKRIIRIEKAMRATCGPAADKGEACAEFSLPIKPLFE